jgi:hypothetical protein
MRIHLAAATAFLLLLTACSTPTVEGPRATVKLAPPPTQQPASTTPTTIAKTPDELEIERVIKLLSDIYIDQLVVGKFDRTPFRELMSESLMDLLEGGLAAQLSKDERVERGAVNIVLISEIRLAPDQQSARALVCDRNNNIIWKANGTVDPTDDTLVQGDLGDSVSLAVMSKVGEKWIQESSESEAPSLAKCGRLLDLSLR